MAETRNGTEMAGSGGSLDGLKALVERAGQFERAPAPVDKWDPERKGEIDIEIRSDGTWLYQGSPIHRERLVKLFATVLRKDADGTTHLVTPVERLTIKVEDAVFVAVEMNASERDGEPVLTFRTNVGDVVEAGPDNPLRFATDPETGGLKPYLLVRGRLEALLARPVMYELMALGEELELDGAMIFAVKSKGVIFPVMTSEELARQSEFG